MILLSVAAFCSSVRAAWLWFRASKAGIDSGRIVGAGFRSDMRNVLSMVRRSADEEREYLRLQWQEIEKQTAWISAAWLASLQSASLNRTAAVWTAASALLTALSVLASAFY
jgi:hypothetical protein